MRKTVKKVIHRIKKIIKGFTIVELIVVIAIISALGSIVTVSVAGQVNKAKDSRVKAEITEMAKCISIYHSDQSTYEGYAVPANFTNVCSGSSYTISANGSSAFVIYAKLCSSNNYWCADSTGAVKQIENAPDSGVYACVSGSGGEDGLVSLADLSVSPNYSCGFNSVCFGISWSPANYPVQDGCSSQREPDKVCLDAQYDVGYGWVDDTNLEMYTLGSYTSSGGYGMGEPISSPCNVTYRLRAERQTPYSYSDWAYISWTDPNCQ